MRVAGPGWERKAFFASLGVDALAARLYARSANGAPAGIGTQARKGAPAMGGRGLAGYAAAIVRALREHVPASLRIEAPGGRVEEVPRSLAAIVSRHPFYGYGLRVNRGRITDSLLHLRVIGSGPLSVPGILARAALRREPRKGLFLEGDRFRIACDRDQPVQVDGEEAEEGRELAFELLPAFLRLLM
jgi:diacylglycerol kinase family enzyme